MTTATAPDTATTALEDTEMPCDCTEHPRLQCDQPAAWIARIVGHPSTGPRLLCDDHAEACRRINVKWPLCSCCGLPFEITLEAL